MRLAGQARMGYFPTPPIVSQAIARSLARSGPGLIRVIDPCCGEGIALCDATAQLGDPVERYGIELKQERSELSRHKLTRVLRADIRSTRIANAAFSFLFLNPPYDYDSRVRLDEAAQRLELYFLQASLRYLQPHGVLAYLIPDKRLDSRIAGLLAHQLEAIQVFRFPADEYARFCQIVLFGIRKPTPFRDDHVLTTLQAIGRSLHTPPDLPEALPTPYTLPVAPPAKTLLFRSLSVDPEDLIQEIDKYGLYEPMLRRLHPDTATHRLRPLMPLRRGHLALVLASGHLNNELVQDPRTRQCLLVKGRTDKDVVRTEVVESDGSTTTIERDVLKIIITALDLKTGELQTMQ